MVTLTVIFYSILIYRGKLEWNKSKSNFYNIKSLLLGVEIILNPYLKINEWFHYKDKLFIKSITKS